MALLKSYKTPLRTKICSLCQTEYPECAFYYYPGRNVFSTYCIPCHKKYMRNYAQRHTVEQRERYLKWYAEHREEHLRKLRTRHWQKKMKKLTEEMPL